MIGIKEIQQVIGTVPDGVWGVKSTAALQDWARYNAVSTPVSALDERSQRELANCDPTLKNLAAIHLKLCGKLGINVKVISGFRSFEEQNEIFAQGRTTPGEIVTKARAGFSMHNYGFAYDVGIFDDSDYVDESPIYNVIGVLGGCVGLDWGAKVIGPWDKPHFQLPGVPSISELYRRHQSRNNRA